MDISAKYEILQYLPGELKKNPERNTIQAFLDKKYHAFSKLMYIMILAFIIYLSALFIFEIVHTSIKELDVIDNIFNLVPLIIFLVSIGMFYFRRKIFFIKDEEIDILIKSIKLNEVKSLSEREKKYKD